MTWQADIVRQKDREMEARQGLDKPFGVLVESVASESEIAKISYFGHNNRAASLAHPFISGNSWIRAIPEAGTMMVASYRVDEAAPQLLQTTQRQTFKRNELYNAGDNIYRPLVPGELELNSIGFAQSYYARRAVLDHRAGAIQRYADQDALTSGDVAPIHSRKFLNNQADSIGDEERVGIVARPKNSFEMEYPKFNGNFGAEYFLEIANPSGSEPAILFRTQKGTVIDSDGNQIIGSTGNPLRYQETFFGRDEQFTVFEVDEKGNFNTSLSASATEGYRLDIPGGGFERNVQLDEKATIVGNMEMSIGKQTNIQSAEDLIMEVAQGDMQLLAALGKIVTEALQLELTGTATAKLSSPLTTVESTTGVLQMSGAAGLVLGSGGANSQVNGSIITLGSGSGLGVARFNDTAIGVGNLGAPVVSTIITSSTQVFSA